MADISDVNDRVIKDLHQRLEGLNGRPRQVNILDARY